MNKKIIAVMLSIVMIVGYSFSAMAATKTLTGTGSDVQDVKGNFTTAPSNSYSVTIEWDSLTYKYTGELEWDSVNNYYKAKDTATTDWDANGGGHLKVTNNSSVSVNAKVEFAFNGKIEGLTATLDEELSSTPIAIPTKATDSEADNDRTALLTISGRPTKILNFTSLNYQDFTMGTVTVTIS